MWRTCKSILSAKHDRKAQSHDIAKRVRPRVAAIAEKYGARVAVAEVPPGPPVLQTLVAEVYGPSEEARLALAARSHAIFKQTPASWMWTGISRPTSRRRALSSTRKRPPCTASARKPFPRRSVSPLVVMPWILLHVPHEKEDVNIVLQLPRSLRTTPEELARPARSFRRCQCIARTRLGHRHSAAHSLARTRAHRGIHDRRRASTTRTLCP